MHIMHIVLCCFWGCLCGRAYAVWMLKVVSFCQNRPKSCLMRFLTTLGKQPLGDIFPAFVIINN